jgi:hypothetical protein
MKEKLKELLVVVKDKIKKLYDFIILSPAKNESVFQYVLRSLMIPDSVGKSSWTYTLVVYFAIIFGCVYLDETDIAKTIVREYGDTGILIKEYTRGYSTGFWSMIMSLTAAVVFFIKFRDTRYSNPVEEKEPSIVQNVIDTTKEIIK